VSRSVFTNVLLEVHKAGGNKTSDPNERSVTASATGPPSSRCTRLVHHGEYSSFLESEKRLWSSLQANCHQLGVDPAKSVRFCFFAIDQTSGSIALYWMVGTNKPLYAAIHCLSLWISPFPAERVQIRPKTAFWTSSDFRIKVDGELFRRWCQWV